MFKLHQNCRYRSPIGLSRLADELRGMELRRRVLQRKEVLRRRESSEVFRVEPCEQFFGSSSGSSSSGGGGNSSLVVEIVVGGGKGMCWCSPSCFWKFEMGEISAAGCYILLQNIDQWSILSTDWHIG